MYPASLRKEFADEVRSGKTMMHVAVERGVSMGLVKKSCIEHGVEIKRGRSTRATQECPIPLAMDRWESIDWTKQDRMISVELGVSRERVRQVRKILRKPGPVSKHRHQIFRDSLTWVRANASELSGLTPSDAAKLCPCRPSVETMKKVCATAGVALESRCQSDRLTADSLAKAASINPITGCWTIPVCTRGYGYAAFGRGYGHRKAYELFKGKIPRGLWVLHTCDNAGCVNPEHLYAGTPTDNARDRMVRGRDAVRKLTYEQAIAARQLFSLGTTITSIAKKYGVNYQVIFGCVKGKTYGHATEGVLHERSQLETSAA